MPKENEELDLSGLGSVGGEDLPTLEELQDPDNAKEIQFFSGALEPDEHQKQASIRMDSMVGEIVDNLERQTIAQEAIATCVGRLVDMLEPLAASLPGNAGG